MLVNLSLLLHVPKYSPLFLDFHLSLKKNTTK